MDDTPISYLKGHGTENDFVLLPDPGARLDVSPALVRAVCDRRSGLGADGVLRIVRSSALPEGAPFAAAAEWFMDYRNADGSIAEMCGNGVRVFARYLVDAELARPGVLVVATRGGLRHVTVGEPAADVTVDMGAPASIDVPEVHVRVGERRYLGVAVSMGNPHVAVPVSDLDDAGDLVGAPVVEPPDVFPGGVNVEFVLGRGPGQIAMRVFERGVGETRSCGTGACAAALAAAQWWGGRPLAYSVEVPGGVLTVTEAADGRLLLAGPAVLVGGGELRSEWVASVLERDGVTT